MAIDQNHDDYHFRSPIDLRLREIPIRRALVVGSCFAQTFAVYRGFFPHFDCDHLLFNFMGELPDSPARPIGDYDLQLVSLPLRTILPDHRLASLPFNDLEAHKALFGESCMILEIMLEGAMKWNVSSKITTFVTNFLVPQQNNVGRTLSRYDLRNPVYFVEKINEKLSSLMSEYSNAYLVDTDEIAATFGRKYIQDDSVYHISHGAYLNNFDYEHDQHRIEAVYPLDHYYSDHVVSYVQAVWHEIGSQYRTINQIDSVKMVVVDLDDTLWRGVMAEEMHRHTTPLEGWPLGIVEALLTLKQRGVILGILSKNDETKVRDLWDGLFGSTLRLSDFAVHRINWKPKATNMEEILREVNLLPKSVVYMDDNPAERDAIKKAFPDIRVLGRHLYYLRRILLWAPEFQVPFITDESVNRTLMVKGQIERSDIQSKMSREEFLATLNVKIGFDIVRSSSDPRFKRCSELVNKTNQFNTTGVRWSFTDFERLFAESGYLCAVDVSDRFVSYGIVGVAVVRGAIIEQFVMSCRVIGLEVEIRSIEHVVGIIKDTMSGAPIFASAVDTEANLLSRDLFKRCGFHEDAEGWILRVGPPANA